MEEKLKSKFINKKRIEVNDFIMKEKDKDFTQKSGTDIITLASAILMIRNSQIIEIKGIPKEELIPLIIEEVLLEINILLHDEKSLTNEVQLSEWIDKQNDKPLTYYYKKYLIAWKILTNDVKIFAPIESRANINIKTIIKFDEKIPELLAKNIKFEDEEYKDEY